MQQTITKIKNYQAEVNISQSQLAREIGVTSGALSAFINGKYQGDNKAIESKVQTFLSNQQTKTEVFIEAPNFIETATAKQVWNTLQFAKFANCLTTVYGASGVGKTKAITEFTRKNPNTWMVTASPAVSSLNEILYEIALSLNLNDAPKRKGNLKRLIKRKIAGTQGLLIIDEADHLPYEALEELRILQEETEIGLVLVGNDKVYTRMKGGVHPAHEYARLWSRVAKNTSIQKVKKKDVEAIATAWGLSKDQKALKIMTEITERGGGLRSLTQTLRLAGMLAKGKGSKITADLILIARKELIGKGDD